MSLSGELYKDNWIGKRATEAANGIARGAELCTVKGHRQSQQGRDKTGYGRCPCKKMQGFDLAKFNGELGRAGFQGKGSQGKHRET
ncbi:hypothetical protein NXW27_00735 (plasmid) [Phocaeicola dorei]|nr:hypothetical protein [Phocaeicola dorei]